MLIGLLIQNGTVVTAEKTFAADVLVEGEVIKEVRSGIAAAGHTIVDAAGMLVLPGGIDAHTH
ncbi:MAG: dihydropyrimidinase, partial [Edaphobacter sp.]